MCLAAAGVVFLGLQTAPRQTGKCHRMSVFYCSLSEGIKLQVSHTAAREKLSFGLKGEATLRVFLTDLVKRANYHEGLVAMYRRIHPINHAAGMSPPLEFQPELDHSG